MTRAFTNREIEPAEPALVAGNKTVLIREWRNEDSNRQLSFFNGLGERSRYFRFMQPLKEIPEPLLCGLSAVDGDRHVLLLAIHIGHWPSAMIAEARYVRDMADPTRCDIALTVTDSWQGRGLGRIMLGQLEDRARKAGIHVMSGETLAENRPMIGLATDSGYEVRICQQDGRIRLFEKALNSEVVPIISKAA